MRKIFFTIVISAFCLTAAAQTYLPFSAANSLYYRPFASFGAFSYNDPLHKAWHLDTYGSLSAGLGVFGGGSTSFLAAPVGLRLTHPLNKNLYAFAGASTAPVFLHYNSAFGATQANPFYPGGQAGRPYQFGMSSRVEMGLMYVNDAKTFSISGSIGVERSSFPGYEPARRPVGKKQ